jgi:hypothetical protein
MKNAPTVDVTAGRFCVAFSAADPNPALRRVPLPANIMHVAAFLPAPITMHMPVMAADVLFIATAIALCHRRKACRER